MTFNLNIQSALKVAVHLRDVYELENIARCRCFMVQMEVMNATLCVAAPDALLHTTAAKYPLRLITSSVVHHTPK